MVFHIGSKKNTNFVYSKLLSEQHYTGRYIILCIGKGGEGRGRGRGSTIKSAMRQNLGDS